jgi:DHA3 family macrolide efflux protein-like MFS transporter
VLSTAGDRLYMMAMLWMSLQFTGSAKGMAITALCESLMFTIVGLVGGAVIDRWSRTKSIIIIDGIRAILVLFIPTAYGLGVLNIWLIVGLGTCMGALDAIFQPAFDALLPSLVSRKQFPGLTGLMDTPSRLARLFGPGMSGLLLAWMPMVGFFALDSFSFVMSAASLFAVHLFHRVNPVVRTLAKPMSHRLRADIGAGIRIVMKDRILRTLFAVECLGNLAFVAYTLGGLLLAIRQLNIGITGYGLLIAAYGVGSLVGNSVAGNLNLGKWRAMAVIGGWAGIGCGFILLGLSKSILPALVGIAIAGAFGALAHVSRNTLIGQRVPEPDLGKVYSLQYIVTTLATALGTVLCGIVLDLWPANFVIVFAGGFLLLSNIVILWKTAPILKFRAGIPPL